MPQVEGYATGLEVRTRGWMGFTPSLLAANIVCVVGSMMLVFAPLLVDRVRHGHVALSERQIALLGSADPTGMLLGAILALMTVPKFNRRLLAIGGLALLCGANGVAMLTAEFSGVLYASRVCAGIGGGLAMGVAYAAFGAASEPERNFALFGTLQTLIGSAAYVGLSALTARFGAAAVYWLSLVLGLLGLAAAFGIEPRAPGNAVPAVSRPARRLLGALIAVTYFALGTTALAVWANVESVGRSWGLAPAAVSGAIAASLLGSVAGSTLIMIIGKRCHRAWPTAGIALAYVGGVALMANSGGFLLFAIAVMAFQCGTNLGTPAFGAISEADPSGRLSIIYLLALKAGFAFGPLAASRLISHDDYRELLLAMLISCVAVGALLGVILYVATPRRRAGPGPSVAGSRST